MGCYGPSGNTDQVELMPLHKCAKGFCRKGHFQSSRSSSLALQVHIFFHRGQCYSKVHMRCNTSVKCIECFKESVLYQNVSAYQ
ncbi:hypothetical protein GDO78_015841 [Eleutherodactylus coqui]|uniref:Uncharacterized protein n=1 Tax=Eleutherodactylus coqui TaxID=57060 RepID=A0A8J6ELH1_ELECQ|nr:hypothetical protein GDO78_015841 [Eleutherodactylus coqui]